MIGTNEVEYVYWCNCANSTDSMLQNASSGKNDEDEEDEDEDDEDAEV